MKTLLTEYILLALILLAFFSVSIALGFNLYPYLSALAPFLWYLSKQPRNPILFFVAFILILMVTINMNYLHFVDYMNKPWFAGEDPFTCDGPCYGWYSFGHDIGDEILFNFVLTLFLAIIVKLAANLIHFFSQKGK